jgi:hypothetical protein
MEIKSKKKIHLSSGFALNLVTLLSLIGIIIMLVSIPVSLSIDSYSYITGDSLVRPSGYDLFVEVFSIGGRTLYAVILCQIVLTFFTPIIIFKSLSFISIRYAFILSLIYLFYPYRYFMAMQIMSEALFIFLYTLFFCFLLRFMILKKNKDFYLSLITLLLGQEVRPTFVFLLIPLTFVFLVLFLKIKNKKKLLIYFLIALFLLFFLKPKITKFDSSDVFPFFVWHHMIQCKDIDRENSNCAIKNNDRYTQELVMLIEKSLNKDEEFYVAMASTYGSRGERLEIRKEFSPYNLATTKKLSRHLVFGVEKEAHIGANLVLNLYRIHGSSEVSALLTKVVFSTFIQNPKSMLQYFFWGNYEGIIKGHQNYLHDSSYWWFIPVSASQNNLAELFPLGSGTYAAWVLNLDERTGRNYDLKVESGTESNSNFKDFRTLTNAFESRNILLASQFLSHYPLELTSRFLILTSPLILGYIFSTSSLLYTIFIYLVAGLLVFSIILIRPWYLFPFICYLTSWIMIYTSWISAPTPRHLIMNGLFLLNCCSTFFITKKFGNKSKNFLPTKKRM